MKYDTCIKNSAGTKGILDQALQDIVTIDANLAAAGLPPLKLAVGLQPGATTPVSYLLDSSVGTIDLAALLSLGGGSSTLCVRLPVPWGMTYIKSYEVAIKALINHITSFSSGALSGDIQIVKPSLISTLTDEFDMDGRDTVTLKTPSDSGMTASGSTILNQGPPIACPDTNPLKNPETYGAQSWVDTFNNQSSSITNCTSGLPNPPALPTLDLEVECAVGRVIGYTRAILDPASGPSTMGNTLTAIDQNGSTLLPDIDCGTAGTSTCVMDNPGEQWSIFYYYQYVIDLLGGSAGGTGIAAAAAAADYASYSGNPNDPPIQKFQIGTEWTSLQFDPNAPDYFTDTNEPLYSPNQIPCGLNNKQAAREPKLFLGSGVTVPTLLGMQTVIGWQTKTLSGGLCATTYPAGGASQPYEYYQLLNSGFTQNSGQYIEIQGDAAFTDLATCAAPLQNALTQLLANHWGTSTCTYP